MAVMMVKMRVSEIVHDQTEARRYPNCRALSMGG
jgi:hypothetical protein